MKDTVIKPVIWVGSSKNDMYKMSSSVKSTFGYALYQAQKGEHPDIAKVLSGFGGASVIELIEDDRGDTFRAVVSKCNLCLSCLSKEEQKRHIHS